MRTSKTVNGVTTNYYWVGSLLAGEEKNGNFTRYLYDAKGSILAMQYHSSTSSENAWTTYWFEKNLQGDVVGVYNSSGTKLVSYVYDAFGNCTATTLGTGASSLANSRNPFRYRGYYYDKDLEMYCLQSRYYDQKIGRFIQPADVSTLNPSSINGLNLYSYANNNPVGITYRSSSVSGSVGGGLVSSIEAGSLFTGNRNPNSTSKGGLNLGWLANGLDTGSTIHGLYTSISGLVNHTAYFAKNLTLFADDMTMLGASMKNGVLAFNQFSWGLGKSDVFGITLGFGLDIYDSIQRGVSPGGVVLGATLTAAKGVGLIYLNKCILYGATTFGSCFGPVGTAVGFAVGEVVCIIVDVLVSDLYDELIDKIAK